MNGGLEFRESARGDMTTKKDTIRYEQALGSNATDKRIDILRRIGEVGSISEAARSAGVSYKAAWQAIETLTNLAGSLLVEKVVGGAGGGGAQLTATGERLLQASDLLTAAKDEVIANLTRAPESAGAMGSLSSLGLRTSMRNQFPCLVKSLRRRSPSMRVELELADGVSLYSTLTNESVQLLGLQPGLQVMALFKATAVVVSAHLDPREGFNTLAGVVTRVTSSRARGEVGLRLNSGLQLVGFGQAGHGLKARAPAMAQVDESGVVIAVAG